MKIICFLMDEGNKNTVSWNSLPMEIKDIILKMAANMWHKELMKRVVKEIPEVKTFWTYDPWRFCRFDAVDIMICRDSRLQFVYYAFDGPGSFRCYTGMEYSLEGPSSYRRYRRSRAVQWFPEIHRIFTPSVERRVGWFGMKPRPVRVFSF